jgi:hypothetical protein
MVPKYKALTTARHGKNTVPNAACGDAANMSLMLTTATQTHSLKQQHQIQICIQLRRV